MIDKGIQGCQTLKKERETVLNNLIAKKNFDKIEVGNKLEILESFGNGKASREKKTTGFVAIKTKGIIIINCGDYRKSYNVADFIGRGFKCRIV